jgi:hypothetical protein
MLYKHQVVAMFEGKGGGEISYVVWIGNRLAKYGDPKKFNCITTFQSALAI